MLLEEAVALSRKMRAYCLVEVVPDLLRAEEVVGAGVGAAVGVDRDHRQGEGEIDRLLEDVEVIDLEVVLTVPEDPEVDHLLMV
jgi:hypothetical protein